MVRLVDFNPILEGKPQWVVIEEQSELGTTRPPQLSSFQDIVSRILVLGVGAAGHISFTLPYSDLRYLVNLACLLHAHQNSSF